MEYGERLSLQRVKKTEKFGAGFLKEELGKYHYHFL